jgi:hypothetical protein
MRFSPTLLISVLAFPWFSSAQDNATVTSATNNATSTPATSPACTSVADCAEGQFCSTTSEVCEALSCANWAAGTPLGETPYSEGPCEAEGAEKGASFCGWDGKCYSYTCENWYKYGPVEFTGYDASNPIELNCADYTTGAVDNMNSVVFGCRPYQPGSKAPEANTWTHFFNQECKSTPRGSDEFKCYQNKAGTDYTDFLGEVSRLNQKTCDRDQEVFTEQPLYWYITQASHERAGQDPVNYKNGREDTASGNSFDASAADKTMFSMLTSPDAAPPQPAPSPTDATTPSAAFIGSDVTKLWISVVLGVAAFLL